MICGAKEKLAPCSNAKRWFEWSEQSLLLFLNWITEVSKNGYWGSPTATWFATTPWAVNEICQQMAIDSLQDGDLLVEIGPGPGPMAQYILRNTRREIEYLAIELNPNYARHLERKIHDPRLRVVNEDAANIGEIVSELRKKARFVLSSMPFSRDEKTTQSILHQIRDQVLRPDGQLLVWNFTPASIEQVEAAFDAENCTRDRVRLNAPFLRTVLTIPSQKLIIPFPETRSDTPFKDVVNQ